MPDQRCTHCWRAHLGRQSHGAPVPHVQVPTRPRTRATVTSRRRRQRSSRAPLPSPSPRRSARPMSGARRTAAIRSRAACRRPTSRTSRTRRCRPPTRTGAPATVTRRLPRRHGGCAPRYKRSGMHAGLRVRHGFRQGRVVQLLRGRGRRSRVLGRDLGRGGDQRVRRRMRSCALSPLRPPACMYRIVYPIAVMHMLRSRTRGCA